jgi:hypothetical protein
VDILFIIIVIYFLIVNYYCKLKEHYFLIVNELVEKMSLIMELSGILELH